MTGRRCTHAKSWDGRTSAARPSSSCAGCPKVTGSPFGGRYVHFCMIWCRPFVGMESFTDSHVVCMMGSGYGTNAVLNGLVRRTVGLDPMPLG